MGNLESTVKVVQGRNGGIETRTSILSLYRNRILFACRISHRLATRISNGIERRIHKGTPCIRQHTQRYPLKGELKLNTLLPFTWPVSCRMTANGCGMVKHGYQHHLLDHHLLDL